ncbi:MAG: AbrB/MazE/SpoVT family DNA-binding domain-containing protein [Acidobacteriia bacterium]|nr:AbrB/MazE/SpoVT family DNA-binding domain-containing protein [Terriglobia bacterium]
MRQSDPPTGEPPTLSGRSYSSRGGRFLGGDRPNGTRCVSPASFHSSGSSTYLSMQARIVNPQTQLRVRRANNGTNNLATLSLPKYSKGKELVVVVKITSKRQVTFPARVLDALGVGAGDQIELIECSDGFMLRPRRIDPARLAPLRSKVRPDRIPFDLESFRNQAHDPALRD